MGILASTKASMVGPGIPDMAPGLGMGFWGSALLFFGARGKGLGLGCRAVEIRM